MTVSLVEPDIAKEICFPKNIIDAIKEAVVGQLELNKAKINHIEGKANSGRVLIDAYQVIINVFSKSERERFNLTQILTRKK